MAPSANFLATDWYFILHSTEAIYCTSKTEYRISLTEDALDDDTELHKNVKRILEVLVGLLKDRVSVSDEPSSKRRRVQETLRKNKRYESAVISIETSCIPGCIYFSR